MANTLWSADARAQLLSRLDRLTPDHRAQWGRMNAPEMVSHLVKGMRLGLGELEVTLWKTPFRFWPLKLVFIYMLPFPRAAAAPRELRTRGSEIDFAAEVQALRKSLDDFAARDPHSKEWPHHPFFGRMNAKYWGAVGWRHMDHHLRQFGV